LKPYGNFSATAAALLIPLATVNRALPLTLPAEIHLRKTPKKPDGLSEYL
jgi:hypothetical protein